MSIDDCEQLQAPQTRLFYWRHFLPQEVSQSLYQVLMAETHWQQDSIKLFGKVIPLPRLQAWYGDQGCHYSYSGLDLSPRSWTKTLISIRHQIKEKAGTRFNTVLLNLYRNGSDSNGWHADNEPELGKNPVIASLSLGETRRFKLRHCFDKTVKPITIDLPSGSLLLMAGTTQHYWQHCLAKTSRTVSPRINLTFRNIVHES